MKHRRRLHHNIFAYSLFVSGVVALLVIICFLLFLPRVYAQNKQVQAIDEVAKTQKRFMKDFNSDEELSHTFFSFKIANNSNKIQFRTNFSTSTTINIKDVQVKKILDDFIKIINSKEFKHTDLKKIDISVLEKLKPQFIDVDIKSIVQDKYNEKESLKFHNRGDVVVIEATTSNEDDYNINYFSINKTNDGVVISVFPLMISKFNDLSDSVISILPSIITIIVIVIVILASIFSRMIIKPINKIVEYAQGLQGNYDEYQPIIIDDNEEMHILAVVLNELHGNLVSSIQEVKNKNDKIMKAKEHQDVFLIASSHQLKTPVSAALLVVEGMIANLGKYQIHEDYLPVVKTELLRMNEMIHEIIELNSVSIVKSDYETITIVNLINNSLAKHDYIIKEKNILVTLKDIYIKRLSNEQMLYKIIDNLISNALKYSDNNTQLIIRQSFNTLEIINSNTQIDDELLQHIFEPFVRSYDNDISGHGLGLYIVQDFAQQLDLSVEIENTDEGVCAKIIF